MIECDYKDGQLSLKSDVCFANNEQVDNLMKVLHLVIGSAEVHPLINADEGVTYFNPKVQQSVPEEKVIIRERLPNVVKDNIIDMSTLKVEKPTIDQAKRFRCPDCMQSVVIQVDGLTIMRDMNKKDHLVIIEGYNFIDNEKFDYEKALELVTELDVTLVTNGDFVGHCPICRGAINEPDRPILTWVQAFDHPEKHCDYENPCPMCGGESLMIITKDNEGEDLQCEDCKYKFKEGI